MGIYTVKCNACGLLYAWFSGNQSAADTCPNCAMKSGAKNVEIAPGETKMTTNDQPLIDALKDAIKAKDELIAYLKMEVDRLKLAQINPVVIQPGITYPEAPFIPGFPGVGQPWYQPPTPPYVVTSGATSTSTFIGKDGLPLGSVQISTVGPTGMGHTGPCQYGCTCDNNKANVSINSADSSSILVLNGVPSSSATLVSDNATPLFGPHFYCTN